MFFAAHHHKPKTRTALQIQNSVRSDTNNRSTAFSEISTHLKRTWSSQALHMEIDAKTCTDARGVLEHSPRRWSSKQACAGPSSWSPRPAAPASVRRRPSHLLLLSWPLEIRTVAAVAAPLRSRLRVTVLFCSCARH